MRKILIILTIIIIFLLIYLLQSNFFNWFNISGVQPNLFILLILFIGLYTNKYIGASLGIIIGIFLYTFIERTLGVTSIMFGVIGFLGGYLDKTFSKDSRLTIMIMVILTTITYEILLYIINIIRFEMTIEILPFIKILSVETIFNTILIIILYPLLQKGGYYVEETFKNSNILTRYF